MARHSLFIESGDWDGDVLVVGGEEAVHAARVKRLRAGDQVRMIDGRGTVMTGELIASGRELRVRIGRKETVPPTRPRIEVWSATPKGPRLDEMIDGLSQVGAAQWCPLVTDRGVVDPGAGKLGRVARIAVEAAKQCGRAWVLEVGERRTFEEATAPEPGVTLVLADSGGGALERSGSETVRLLVGPEGGWTARERERARMAGARSVSLGPFALRMETAAVVGAAMTLAAERRA